MAAGKGPKTGQIHKDVRPLVKAARKAKWSVEPTGSSHWRMRSPDGRHTVILAGTASDWRNLRNLRGDLRRAGLKV